MRLTRAGEYGLRGMLYLAAQPEGKVTLLSDVAAAQDIPYSFLGKIFSHLARAGVVRSVRGFHGGFVLAKPPSEITMQEVIEIVEGEIRLNDCSQAGGAMCQRKTVCAMQPVWEETQEKVREVLRRTTFADLVSREKTLQEKVLESTKA